MILDFCHECIQRICNMTKLIDNGVEILTKLRFIDTTDNGVTAIDRGQNEVNVDGDKVVLAVGLISQATLYQQLEGKSS